MKRPLLIYGLLWALCGIGVAAILHTGNSLPPIPPATGPGVATVAAHPGLFLHEDYASSLGRLLLQLIIIVAACRTAGLFFRRFGLPAVVGEITAGILLGPSLLGRFWPGGFDFIFAAQSLGILHLCSQIGVTVFMFVVGMELEVDNLRENARTAILTSQIGILVPYLFGMASAIFLYSRYAGAGTSLAVFALFLGIAMSVTAFPVLVRILEERGMVKTSLGSISIACAAVGDVSAWIILALLVAFARGKGMEATLFNLGLLAIFVALMLGVVRRWLPRLIGTEKLGGRAPARWTFVAALLFMAASALATEGMGIHALFGAFLAGAIMPRHKAFHDHLMARLQSISRGLLLPLYFAFSGLRTHIGLLNDVTSWQVCLAIVVIASAGKLGGSMLAARLDGMRWSDAFAFGSLMNTRGLMELIALNIGYDLGVLSPSIFAMLVLMALITTFLTGPLLSLSGQRAKAAV
jgi:Kef-type K+ transport system membrane component KefB